MTDEQINALAREYANQGIFIEEYATSREMLAKDVLKWLSDRYCIVEKEKIKEHYDDVTQDIADYKGEGMWGLGAADPTMCERAKPTTMTLTNRPKQKPRECEYYAGWGYCGLPSKAPSISIRICRAHRCDYCPDFTPKTKEE